MVTSGISAHAQARMQQRGVNEMVLDRLFEYGKVAHDHHDGEVIFFNILTKSECIAYNAIIDCTPMKPMASITIRNLDEQTKERLRVRAARRKRSMEEEARNILRTALARDSATPGNLAEAIRRRFEPLGGVVIPLPAREPIREPPRLGK